MCALTSNAIVASGNSLKVKLYMHTDSFMASFIGIVSDCGVLVWMSHCNIILLREQHRNQQGIILSQFCYETFRMRTKMMQVTYKPPSLRTSSSLNSLLLLLSHSWWGFSSHRGSDMYCREARDRSLPIHSLTSPSPLHNTWQCLCACCSPGHKDIEDRCLWVFLATSL